MRQAEGPELQRFRWKMPKKTPSLNLSGTCRTHEQVARPPKQAELAWLSGGFADK
jgi:hypothetical protein